jgi:hypothetical protein
MQVPTVNPSTMMHHTPEAYYGVQGGQYCHVPQGTMQQPMPEGSAAYTIPENFLDEVPLPAFCLSAFEKYAEKNVLLDDGMMHGFVDGQGKMLTEQEDFSYHLPPSVNYVNLEY